MHIEQASAYSPPENHDAVQQLCLNKGFERDQVQTIVSVPAHERVPKHAQANTSGSLSDRQRIHLSES